MLFIFVAVALLFLASLFLPVYFIILYNNEVRVSFRFLFFRKKIPLDVKSKGEDLSDVFGELSKAKDTVLDLYGKLNGKIKIARIKIHASVNMSDAFLFPLIFAAVNSAIGAFIAALDFTLEVDRRNTEITLNSAFLDTPAAVFGKIVLKTSLFHFLFASTYALFKAIFKGGKNGRKQAKRDN